METSPLEPTPPGPPPLTEEQEVIANTLVDVCGLEDVAETQLAMMGASGTVRYGLGRCAGYLGHLTPDEIKDMVMEKLNEQEQAAERQAS